jgi:hypothetical protein
MFERGASVKQWQATNYTEENTYVVYDCTTHLMQNRCDLPK